MYKPLFNTVLVEIDDEEAKWGNGNDDSMLGKSYRQGKVISKGMMIPTADYLIDKLNPSDITKWLEVWNDIGGKQIMWNEGTEAGTIHEHDGKQYAFIYWFDIRGIKDES